MAEVSKEIVLGMSIRDALFSPKKTGGTASQIVLHGSRSFKRWMCAGGNGLLSCVGSRERTACMLLISGISESSGYAQSSQFHSYDVMLVTSLIPIE